MAYGWDVSWALIIAIRESKWSCRDGVSASRTGAEIEKALRWRALFQSGDLMGSRVGALGSTRTPCG
jgi:hypothetical protein